MGADAFIIDCPWCKAKVAAVQKCRAEKSGYDHDSGEPFAFLLAIGECPTCFSLIVGESYQFGFQGHNSDEDQWRDYVRVYPKPVKTFSSNRIPRVALDSLLEADRCLQAAANIASCVMLGRAFEAICRDQLEASTPVANSKGGKPTTKKQIMLAEGIRRLKEKGLIDERLYDWSQQLHAFRNLAAHPEDISISRADASDLQTFVHAIVEYIYDLTDLYNDFKERVEARKKKKKA
jgi:hypothetical protein